MSESKSLTVQDVENMLNETHWYFIDTEIPNEKFTCSFSEGNLILNNIEYSKYSIIQIDRDTFFIGLQSNPHFGATIAKITPTELILIGNKGGFFPYHILEL